MDDEVSKLSYKAAQQRCKDLGLKASGKLVDLQDRIRHHFAEESGDDAPQDVKESPDPAPPAAADDDPIPVKHSEGGFGLLLVFLVFSATFVVASMYTARIDWNPIIGKGVTRDDGVREYMRQAQDLFQSDLVAAAGAKQAFLKWRDESQVTIKRSIKTAPAAFKEFYEGMAAEFSRSSLLSPFSASQRRACQAKPKEGEGMRFPKLGLSRTFVTTGDATRKGFFQFSTKMATLSMRSKAVSYAAWFEGADGAVETAQSAMERLGCNDPEFNEGRCLLVDIGKLAETSTRQAAALQALLAKQLKEQPLTLFFIINAESLDDSGASVLLNLMGEHGSLNEPGCDIATYHSAQILLVPKPPGAAADATPADVLQEAWVKTLDKGDSACCEATADALRRRIADTPTELVSKAAAEEAAAAKSAAAARKHAAQDVTRVAPQEGQEAAAGQEERGAASGFAQAAATPGGGGRGGVSASGSGDSVTIETSESADGSKKSVRVEASSTGGDTTRSSEL